MSISTHEEIINTNQYEATDSSDTEGTISKRYIINNSSMEDNRSESLIVQTSRGERKKRMQGWLEELGIGNDATSDN